MRKDLSMAYSEVPRIALNQDGKITLYVNVGGFKPGTPVEISGYATQTSGAVATFQSVQIMPNPNDPNDPHYDPNYDPNYGVIMPVTDVPVIGPPFEPADPVTVIARAADVWITELELEAAGAQLDQPVQAAIARIREVNPKAAWDSVEGSYHSVYGSNYGPPGAPPAS
jgi:hypothetical protein